MAKDINSDAMSNLLQGLTSDNENATGSFTTMKDHNLNSDLLIRQSRKENS